MTRRIAAVAVLALGLVAAGCNRSSEPEVTTTSTTVASTATTAESPTTTVDATTTTLAGQPVESYTVVARSSMPEGEVLYVVIPSGGYTDTDLEGFVAELVDSTDGLWELHVFDDTAGADALLTPEAERTDDDEQALESHYLVALLDGSIISFQGPFSDSGEYILGS